MVSATPLSVMACGWWGDGEDDDTDAIVIGPDGQPVSPAMPVWNQEGGTIIPNELEVPAPRSGYGIVVRPDGSAVPYLKAIPGQRAYSIQQLHTAGYSGVIDLGTPPMVALLHQRETEELGMRYFNIPVDGDVPGKGHAMRFDDILSAEENLPILVFSASADLLGGLWTLHRLRAGISKQDAIREGRTLGLSENTIQQLIK